VEFRTGRGNDGGLLLPCQMITALAVETLLVSVLAWMSIQASVTLAAILTVILLPWALLSMRKSVGFAWMTLAMIGMLWRGEAWKTVYLAEEAQLSQCLQSLPKTVSIRQRTLSDCDGARRVLPQILRPFLAEEFEETHQSLKGIQTPQDRSEHRKGVHKAPVTLQPLDLEACLALMNAEPDFERREPHLGSQTDFRRSELELPAQSDPTASDFI
jgi:hypothetical protein